MSNQYHAWLNTSTGGAFFNPVGIVRVHPVGAEVKGCFVVATGDLSRIEAVVSSINATLPPVSFAVLLSESKE